MMQDILFWNNSLQDLLIALAVFIIVIIVLKIFRGVGVSKLKKLSERTKMEFDDLLIKVIKSIGFLFYFILALYIALKFINVPSIISSIVYYAVLVIVIYYAIKIVQQIIDFGAQRIIIKRQRENEKFEPQTIKLFSGILKIIVWLIAIVLILQNLGYNISALIAGLGIGGIAIAFALQNVLTDIFASFSIFFDKPFQIGDFIVIGKDMGTVKKIGIKSTRIETLQGQELIVSNKELTETRVNNFKKMEKRRIGFSLGVEYSTSSEKLKKIPAIIRDIFNRFEIVDLDRVHFKQFGDSSLDYEIVFYIKSSDYSQYMDVQQEINLAIKEEFEKEDIVFAYPSQTIYLNKS